MKLKIIKLKTVKSTNNIALKFIKRKKIKPTLITSIKQTHGRGTMGKKWISKKGNLFISIYFQIDQKKINFRQYVLLNAYLFKNVIRKFSKKKTFIKWPNDIMIQKKKICGILQEVIKINDNSFLIIGAGINTNSAPIIKNYKVTSLSSILSRKIDNNIILKDVINKYEKFIPQIHKYSFNKLKNKILKNK